MGAQQFKGKQYAVQKGYPCIHLGDAGGGCVPDIMGGAGMMNMGLSHQERRTASPPCAAHHRHPGRMLRRRSLDRVAVQHRHPGQRHRQIRALESKRAEKRRSLFDAHRLVLKGAINVLQAEFEAS